MRWLLLLLLVPCVHAQVSDEEMAQIFAESPQDRQLVLAELGSMQPWFKARMASAMEQDSSVFRSLQRQFACYIELLRSPEQPTVTDAQLTIIAHSELKPSDIAMIVYG